MKRWRLIGQCTALAGAIVLLGGYVYVQAGGKLWPWHSQPASDEEQPPIMSSSKLGVLRLPPGSYPGETSQESAVPPGDAPPDGPSRAMIMAGSKSAVLIDSDELGRLVGNRVVSSGESSTATAAPPEEKRPVIMGGSKSRMILGGTTSPLGHTQQP